MAKGYVKDCLGLDPNPQRETSEPVSSSWISGFDSIILSLTETEMKDLSRCRERVLKVN